MNGGKIIIWKVGRVFLKSPDLTKSYFLNIMKKLDFSDFLKKSKIPSKELIHFLDLFVGNLEEKTFFRLKTHKK